MVVALLSIVKQITSYTDIDIYLIRAATGKYRTFGLNKMPLMKISMPLLVA